jgi:hypothetical protein
MPYWHAKSRRRLKHVQSIFIMPSTHGGVRSCIMKAHAEGFVPIGIIWFESVDAAKKDAEQEFHIKPSDWIEEPGTPEFATQIETLAAEATKKYAAAAAAAAQPKIDYVKQNELLMRRFTPAQGRRFKKLLPGTWIWEDHKLSIHSDGTWNLYYPSQVRLKRFDTPHFGTHGRWAYGTGSVTFSVPNTFSSGYICQTLCILDLDDEKFVYHADPEPVRLKRHRENST